MSELSRGMRELTWSGGIAGDVLVKRCNQFAADNVCRLQTNSSSRDLSQSGRVRAYCADGFTLLYCECSGEKLRTGIEVRDEYAIAADRIDKFGISLPLTGTRRMTQGRRTCDCTAGSMTLFSSAEPYIAEIIASDKKVELVSLYMPRQFVEQRVVNPDEICVKLAASEMSGLATETLRLFANRVWQYSVEEFYKSVRAVAELILLGFDETADLSSTKRSMQAANLARVKAILRQRIADPDVTLADVARASNLSQNYLHRLFRGEGTTPWVYLKSQRLRRAREMLQVAASRGMSVTEVSLSCGFSDSSHFSRAFRQAFGMTPREAILRS